MMRGEVQTTTLSQWLSEFFGLHFFTTVCFCFSYKQTYCLSSAFSLGQDKLCFYVYLAVKSYWLRQLQLEPDEILRTTQQYGLHVPMFPLLPFVSVSIMRFLVGLSGMQKVRGPTEIWTRIAGFKVQSANHYTMEPWVLQWQDCSHLAINTMADWNKKICFLPGSNRRPCACEAHVITTTLRKLPWQLGKKYNHPIWGSNPGPLD